jgi:Prolyl oligopeptidase family
VVRIRDFWLRPIRSAQCIYVSYYTQWSNRALLNNVSIGRRPAFPNTWRDFIACAEYLIDKRYTSPPHLSGLGGSAGGILIGGRSKNGQTSLLLPSLTFRWPTC